MLKKLSLLAAVCAVAAPALAEVNVSSVASTANPAGLPATFDFNSPTSAYSGTIYTDSVSGVRAQPVGSTGGYASVGPVGAGNNEASAILDLSSFGAIDSITFLWGSVDTYNILDVLGTTMSFNGGSNGVAPATGDQSTDRLVTLTFTGADRLGVTGLQFSSTGNAFEFDNVNVVTGAVPEPATWAMMVGGFGLLGAAARRSRKPAVRFA